MQLFFAVVGDAVRTEPVFRALVESTARSNPGSEIEIQQNPGAKVGYESRAFDSLGLDDRGIQIHLDGVVRSIDGQRIPTSESRGVTLQRLVTVYEEAGDAIWERIDGSYRLVLVDGSEVHSGVDIAGTRSLYWWAVDGVWACHSQLMDLARAYPRELHVDDGAVGNYCETGRYPTGATPYREIRHLGAGQFLVSGGGGVIEHDHFSRAPRPPGPSRPVEQLAGEFIDLMADAVSSMIGGADRPVIPLSGGMDSRFIATLAVRELGPEAVRTITWGEEPDRPSADGVVARQVAARLGVENTWYSKTQKHTHESFARAIYLSSGETDHAIHFPGDHSFHAELAQVHGYGSIVRGDELLGGGEDRHRIMSTRGALGYAELHRIALDRRYPELLGESTFRSMAEEQGSWLRDIAGHLHATSAYGKYLEIYYMIWMRRMLAPYNLVKNTDLEVLTPFLDRQVNEWVKSVPDRLIARKRLLWAALQKLDPEIAAVPFATIPNLPSWPSRWRQDPSLTAFFREWCSQPGWLDEIGAKERVIAAIDQMTDEVRPNQSIAANPPRPRDRAAPGGWGTRSKTALRHTTLGRWLSEQTVEYRVTRRHLPMYLRICRLSVLHRMLGDVSKARASRESTTSR